MYHFTLSAKFSLIKIQGIHIIYLVTALVLTALNFIFLGVLWQHFTIYTFDLWHKTFKIFPIFEQTRTEMFIMNLFPMVVSLFLMKWKIKRVSKVLLAFLFAYVSVFLATFLGNFFSLFLWGRNGLSPLFPDELRTAPFPFYWLVFVLLGLMLYWFLEKK